MRAMLDELNKKKPVTAAEAGRFIATFMPHVLWVVAPEIVPFAIETSRYETAKATIAREYERAWANGAPLDNAKVARLTLRAFSDTDVAGSYGKAHAMRRTRRGKQK